MKPIPKGLNFDELLAHRGFRNRSEFGRSCGLPRSVLSLCAQGWPGAGPTRRILREHLEIDAEALNGVLLRSWHAHVRSIPKET